MKKLKELNTKKFLDYFYKILFTIAVILVYLCVPVMVIKIFNNCFGIDNLIFTNGIGTLVTLLILILIFNRTLIKQYYDFKKNWKKYMIFTIKCWAIGLGIMMFSNLIINFFIFDGNTIAGNEEEVRNMLIKYPVYGLFSAVLLAPIAEEIVFRLNFKKLFNNAIVFSIVTGLLFGGLHLVTDFNSIKDLCYIIPYSALGIAFGYAYYKNNNIFSTMIMHAFHNAVVYTLIIIVYLGV